MKENLLANKEVYIFDFDGVLADSVGIKTQAFADLYKDYGDEVVHAVVSHHLENGGLSRFKKIEHIQRNILGKAFDKTENNKICEKFSQFVVEKIVKARPIPGAEIFLSEAQKNKKCYVNTATPEDEAVHIISQKGWKKFFNGILGSPASKAENLRKIIQDNGVYKIDKFLFFGDSKSDFDAAKKVGVSFVGIAADAESPLLGLVDNNHLIESFEEFSR